MQSVNIKTTSELVVVVKRIPPRLGKETREKLCIGQYRIILPRV